MRSTNAIAAEIKGLAAKDKSYNRVVNEGGEGYERDSTRELRLEWLEAEKAEFAAAWTLDVLTARRAAWNAEIAVLADRKVVMTARVVLEVVARLGYNLDQIRRAKALHGIA